MTAEEIADTIWNMLVLLPLDEQDMVQEVIGRLNEHVSHG